MRRYSASEREQHVKEMETKGLTVREYSELSGIVTTTLHGWKKRREQPMERLIRVDNFGKEVVIELRSGALVKVPVGEERVLKAIFGVLNAGN